MWRQYHWWWYVRKKTFSIFYASNMLLQQQYRERGFKKYCELISRLLMAKQNNELLMKSHESWLIGSTPFPEVKAMRYNNNYGCCCNRGRGLGHERRQINYRNYSDCTNPHRTRRNKKGYWSCTCYMANHLVDLY